MIPVWVVIAILFSHWVADFVLQPHWMSLRKSKEWLVLLQHAMIITIGMLVAAQFIVVWHHFAHQHARFRHVMYVGLPLFAVINGAGHFCIDAVTSRVTSWLYAKQSLHYFFVVIGFDQFMHVSMLVATWWWLIR